MTPIGTGADAADAADGTDGATGDVLRDVDEPWADPIAVTDDADCYFYQTIELPELGVRHGEWDLRGGVDDYLGGIDVGGRRVLELGTANGYLCLEMEKRGADVVAFDLGEGDEWDLVPYDGRIPDALRAERRALARRLHNAWWLAHRLTGSRARAVYGSVYAVPESIGEVDVATFGSILLHLRDPFRALACTAPMVTDAIVVTDMLPVPRRRSLAGVAQLFRRFAPTAADRALPDLTFLPDRARGAPTDTWWRLSPTIVARFLDVLGFPEHRVTYHRQTHHHPTTRQLPMYTVVARR